jgi:hypothetical protein
MSGPSEPSSPELRMTLVAIKLLQGAQGLWGALGGLVQPNDSWAT